MYADMNCSTLIEVQNIRLKPNTTDHTQNAAIYVAWKWKQDIRDKENNLNKKK